MNARDRTLQWHAMADTQRDILAEPQIIHLVITTYCRAKCAKVIVRILFENYIYG